MTSRKEASNIVSAANKAYAKTNKAYAHLFLTPDGEIVMADLERQFGGNLLRKADGVVDANACLAAIGSFKVIQHIKDKTKDGNMAR